MLHILRPAPCIFQLAHNASYSVTKTGWGTEAHILPMSEEWAIAKIEIDGMTLEEIEMARGSRIYVPFGDVLLDAGNHTLRVTMTNDLNIYLGGERKLYVESVKLI